MIIIRTAEAMAHVLHQPLDNPLLDRLRQHKDTLSLYDDMSLEDLALFVIVQAGDTLAEVEERCGYRLVEEGAFAFPVETIDFLPGWYEVTWIISDDGYGLVLFVQVHPETDPGLLDACRLAAAQAILPNP